MHRVEVMDMLDLIERARRNYNKAIELNPNYANAYLNRAAIYRYWEEPAMAIDDYNKAIKLEPNNGYGYYWRSKSFNKLVILSKLNRI